MGKALNIVSTSKIILKIIFISLVITLLGIKEGNLRYLYAEISSNERAALIALYNSTDGDNWTNNSGWKEEPLDIDGFAMKGTENNWHGITCDGGNTSVLRVEVQSNNLNGPIPSELGNLTNLQTLYLYSNQLIGSIPLELENLANLQYLRLVQSAHREYPISAGKPDKSPRS